MSDPYANPYGLPEQSVVPQGYLPPPAAYQAVDSHHDPLIPPPHGGVNGWFDRITKMFKRSWRSIATIFALTQLLPAMLLAVAGVILAVGMQDWILSLDPNTGTRDGSSPFGDINPGVFVAALLGVFVVVILLVLSQMAGYAAATFAVTREAAGLPVRLGEAMAYGFRRSLGLFGWYLLVGLLTMLGAIACVLPAFYVYAATALVGPILLFERSNPIGRSFSIFNSNLGRILGRLALILVAMIAGGIAVNIVESVIQLVGGGVSSGLSLDASAAAPTITVVAVIAALVGAVLQLPVTMFQFAGILVTYTEQRGHEGATTAHLVHELG